MRTKASGTEAARSPEAAAGTSTAAAAYLSHAVMSPAHGDSTGDLISGGLLARVPNSPRMLTQRQAITQLQSSAPTTEGGAAPVQRAARGGLPDALRLGMENLSGMDLSDVQVHRNSAQPAQLNAHAFARDEHIHLAPGQDQHLGHEAWHVVQQRQGRVPVTTQMAGMGVNDDPALEREADTMGARALRTPRPSRPATAQRASSQTRARTRALQGKFDFADAEKRFPPQGVDAIHELALPLHGRVLHALRENKELLVSLSSLEAYAEIVDELSRELAFCNNVYSLVISSTDYGVVNLGNPQHVALYFKAAARFLNKNYLDQYETEKPETEKQELAQRGWQVLKETAPAPDKAFQTAFLGTGASIAYYLNAKGHGVDPLTTVIIGKQQPWDPSNKESGRGIDFVNHPMHMTSPRRESTQLPKERSGRDESFKGNAQKLTDDITHTLSAYGEPVNAKVNKVQKLQDEHKGWYEVDTSLGKYFARKVLAGLGIGPHAVPKNAHAATIAGEAKKEEGKRLIDLDTFQQQLKDPASFVMQERARRGNLIIGVAGPNAGVDAVYEATNLGMEVAWVVTGGPAIAEGMGNKISRKELVDLHFDYLNGWKIHGQLIEMELSGKWRGVSSAQDQKKAEDEFIQKNPGWDISQKKSALVHFLVYAQGPDVQKVWSVFDPSVTQDLALRGDAEGRFGAHPDSDFWQGSVTTSVRSAPYNIYWESIYNRVAEVLNDKPSLWEKTRDAMRAEVLKILNTAEFERIELPKIEGVGLGTEDGSFEIIGGSVIRILDYLDGQKRNHDSKLKDAEKPQNDGPKLRLEAQQILEKIPAKLRSGDTGAKMRKVIDTLSTPTLLNNDQLTPIRSQLEAMSKYMPGYIGSEESNFVTDDQDMIAAQIAGWYGNIPSALASWVTQKIIQDRHTRGVRPGTDGGGRAFVEDWKTKLEALHVLFSTDRVKALAEG